MNEIEQTRQHIQVISIQLETLAQLLPVKKFLELTEKQKLLIKTLPDKKPKLEET